MLLQNYYTVEGFQGVQLNVPFLCVSMQEQDPECDYICLASNLKKKSYLKEKKSGHLSEILKEGVQKTNP